MAWLWKAFDSLQDYLASLAPQPVTSFHPQLTQLNDYVYEVCKPVGRPSVEIIFFHGLQLDGSKEDFITTWLSRDGSELWPKWIAKRFPEARILLISYDGSARRKDDQGCTDAYITGENLIQSLTDEAAQVGRDGCPVVLVGHCLGGLVIKEFLLRANSMLSLVTPDNPLDDVQFLLENVKGLFFYATPHHGSRFADHETGFPKGLLVKRITTLNKKAARCNEDFRKLRQNYRWRASGLAESLPITLGTFKTQFVVPEEASGSQLVVEEASTRSDVDTLYTVQAHHFDICRPESKADSRFCHLIDVVDRALKEDVPGHKMYFSSEVVGLDDQVEIVKKSLKEARRLGIVGTGGMGKSTLAKAVYNSISNDFDYTCFLSNVKNSVNKTDTKEVLQEEILKNLCYKGRRKMVHWSRLRGKKNLFIFDDVEYASQVYARLDSFADESCVLVTSRDRRFVRSMDFEVHDAIVLDDKASNQLFCLHAFKGADIPEVYKTRVALFIEKCGGLPLALEVAGKYLFTQNREGVWDDALNRLSQAKALDGREDDELWSIFREIYRSLAEDEKQMFLDIAVCFHGEELESVKRAWRACSWAEFSADAGWQNLLDKGLVTITPFRKREHHGTWIDGTWTEDGCIQMHEVLRDLGCNIACTNRKIDQNSTRICYDVFNQLHKWPFSQGKPNFGVRVLKIVSKEHPRPKIDIETISGLEKLEILWLDGVNLSGSRNLTLFPDNLAFLKLRRCDWRDNYYFERLFEPLFKKFSVEGSSSRRETSSQKVAEHPTLRHFEIEEFKDLQHLLNTLSLDARGQLQALEDLKFEGHPDRSPRVQALPETFEQLRYIRIDDFTINISRCSGLAAPTKHLTISGCWLSAVPDTLGQLRGLRHLIISRCPHLCNLPESFGELLALEHLEISYCDKLRALPESFGDLRALEHLEISFCDSLHALPASFGMLRGLRHMQVSNCLGFRRLPVSFGELSSLEHLHISYCKNLQLLSDGFGWLRSLEHLVISYCTILQALPESFGLLLGLRDFVISHCPRLDGLPENFGQLPALEHLEISYCNLLQALPETFGLLSGLRHFVISNCPDLYHLPDTLGEFPALEHLEISYCHSLEALPEAFGPLRGLKYCIISNCPGLHRLPDTLGELPALEHIEIYCCDRLQALPNSLRQVLGRSSCSFCGNCGHSENDCTLKQESQLKEDERTVANLSTIKPPANVEGASTWSAFKEGVPAHHKVRVGRVCQLPPRKVVGLDGQVEAVKMAFKKTRRLVIVGKKEVGKSTLAEAVYNSIAEEFEYTCFLKFLDDFEYVREGQILGSLNYNCPFEMTNRSSLEWNQLKGKKILFIFDDVTYVSDVYIRLLDDLSDDSRVLITSRDSRLLRSLNFKCYYVKLLDADASYRLFCHHAFKGADVPDVYRDSVSRIIEKCRGLPLILEVTGKYLSTQKLGAVWDDTLDELTKGVRSMFEVIYDSLAEDEKLMFLDVAMCFHGEKLSSVKRAWRACSWAEFSADAGWQKLLDMGLITTTSLNETDPNARWIDATRLRHGYIQMHKEFRGLGQRKASLDRRWKTIHRARQLTAALANQEMSDVRVLKIVLEGASMNSNFVPIRTWFEIRGRSVINIEQLRGLEKLEILWLDGVDLDGACEMFPVNLKFLKFKRCSWRGWSVSSISEKLREHPTLRHFEFEDFDQHTRGRNHTLAQLQAFERCPL